MSKYMVLIIGKQMPTVFHDNYEQAEAEAKRLARLEGLNAYVLQVVSTIEITTTVKYN